MHPSFLRCSTNFRVRAALQPCARNEALRLCWVSAWQSASRAVTSISNSRAACHLMDVLLRLGIVPFSAVSETAQSMLLSIELSGPALLTESSSSFLTTLIRERVTENPTNFNSTAERILNWTLSRWTPGRYCLSYVGELANTVKDYGLNARIRPQTQAIATPATYCVFSTLVWIDPSASSNQRRF